MTNILDQLKHYWFLIVFIFGGVAAITTILSDNYVGGVADDTLKGDAAKLYIQELIADELADDATITALHGKLELHGSKIDGNTSDIALTQTQLQDVARILMTPPD